MLIMDSAKRSVPLPIVLAQPAMTTITDVAKRAGVAPVTVSRVINGAPNVNPATRERVERTIVELGYVPNVVARSLRSKRTRTLAFVVPDITNPFWTTVARGVEDAAQEYGYSVLLCNTDENLAKQQRYVDILISQRVDGVIIAPSSTDATKLAALCDHDIATVVLDRRLEGWKMDMVYSDSISGAYALVRHLIGLGHTRIAILSGPEGAATAEDRIAGYRLALHEAGIPVDPRLIRRGGFNSQAGAMLTRELLDEGLGVTAIFAANNAIALGTIEAIRLRGLRIPRDVALVCFDDYPYTAGFFPFLTVVAQSAYDMGANAAQLLFSRLQSDVPLKPRRVVLPVRLIVRYSCGSALTADKSYLPELPLEGLPEERIILVKPLSPETLHRLQPAGAPDQIEVLPGRIADVQQLRRVLRYEPADRIPHLELRVAGRALYEHVLERKLHLEPTEPGLPATAIPPAVQIEFAQRLGLDAIACELCRQPHNLTEVTAAKPATLLAAQLNHLERFLRAAQGSGVGVFVVIRSFCAGMLRAGGHKNLATAGNGDLAQLEQLMDALLLQRERLLRAICDRFAADLAFVLISDDLTDRHGLILPAELFSKLIQARMARLIAPAREHGLITALRTGGHVADLLPFLYEIGFDAVHGLTPEYNDLPALHRTWAGKLAFMGGISEHLLIKGERDAITEAVRRLCAAFDPPSGFVLGSATGISEAVPPQNFVALVEAGRKYGRRALSEAQTESLAMAHLP